MIDKKQTSHNYTESELIKGCVAKERGCQNELFNIYSKKMMTICLRYTKTRADAEDVLTTGFMRVFEKIELYKETGSIEGWIRKVIVNIAIEKFHREAKKIYNDKDLDAVSYNMKNDTDIFDELNTKDLMILIQKLPPMYQMVFNLHVIEGYKHNEIAEKLGISEGTSKSNLSDARKWLQKHIEILSYEKKAI